MSHSRKQAGDRQESGQQFEAETLLRGLAAMLASGVASPSQADIKTEPIPIDDEARYRALVDQIPAVIFMAYLDRADTRAYISPHIETALGFSQEEWLDDPVRWYHRIHPDDKDRWSAEAAETLVSGKPLRSVYRVIARDGRVVWLQCEVKMFRRETGEFWFIHGVAVDISEIKQAEEKLQKAQEELERRIRERTATLEIEVELRKGGEIELAEKLQQLQCLYETASAASQASSFDDVLSVALTGLRSALKADRASILLFDPDGVMRFKASVGLSSEYRTAVEGHSPWSSDSRNPQPIVVPDVLEEPSLNAFRAIISNEGIRALAFIPLSGEARLLGKLMAYYDTPHALTESEIQIAQTIASHISFSIERKLAEEQRTELLAREQAARREAEHANRLKDEFLATVSHELRTPLSAVSGWAQLLREKLDEPTRERALKVIEHNTKIQAKLLEDILDVSRVSSGKLLLDLHPVHLPAIIDNAIETVLPAAESKAIRVVKAIDSDAGLVEGDSDRLEQVVRNLLSNAIKFTPEGGRVEVLLERLDSQVEITVRDTGEGIQADFLPHVFEPFRQADASFSRRHGGLGLGLPIVRRVVALHGGTVQAHSDGPGTGSIFTIRLPLLPGSPDRKNEASGAADRMAPTLEGLHVLVVEDDADTRDLLAVHLQNQGVEVRLAATASEALQSFRLNQPDVLISDIGLPGEDGIALIRRIRALEANEGGDVPALALSAYARPVERQQAIAAGFQMHLAKPIDPLELTRAIEDLVRSAGGGENKGKELRQQRSFRIVVIEDAKDLAEVFAIVLKEMGHEVHVFYDGPAALSQIRSIRPEIVFSDISMRDMDGYELAKQLRKIPETCNAILVAMTGFSKGNAGHALRAGFDYHMVKPVMQERLREFFSGLTVQSAKQ